MRIIPSIVLQTCQSFIYKCIYHCGWVKFFRFTVFTLLKNAFLKLSPWYDLIINPPFQNNIPHKFSQKNLSLYEKLFFRGEHYEQCLIECLVWSSCLEVFCKKDVLRNFTKFTGKNLCQSNFFNKVADLGLKFYKK